MWVWAEGPNWRGVINDDGVYSKIPPPGKTCLWSLEDSRCIIFYMWAIKKSIYSNGNTSAPLPALLSLVSSQTHFDQRPRLLSKSDSKVSPQEAWLSTAAAWPEQLLQTLLFMSAGSLFKSMLGCGTPPAVTLKAEKAATLLILTEPPISLLRWIHLWGIGMNGPLCFIIIISGTGSHTHAGAVLTEGLYPDGSSATTYCTTNTSFRLCSRPWPH